jgi:hypothetical protein
MKKTPKIHNSHKLPAVKQGQANRTSAASSGATSFSHSGRKLFFGASALLWYLSGRARINLTGTKVYYPAVLADK